MEVVGPDPVDSPAAALGRFHQRHEVPVIFCEDRDRPPGRGPGRRRDLGDDVRMAVVHERMRRVEPQAVEPILSNPVNGVVDDQAADHRRARTIEVDGAAPRRVMPFVDVFRQELRQVRALRPEVVVDDIEDDAQPETVRRVDELPQIVGMAVVLRRRVQVDAVVSPVPASGKRRDRQQLDRGRTERAQISEALACGGKRPAHP